jgi:beta-barrel assembly-enhancing protease
MNPRFLIVARRSLCLSIAILLASPGLIANSDPRRGRVTENPRVGNHTFEQEVQIGRQGVAQIEPRLRLLPPDHPLSQYIASLGQRLAANAPGFRFPFTFRVVQEESINAFALPGGPIYVHTGLIAAASEPELAGVLGHEIAHVVMRHSLRQANRATRTQLPFAVLSGVLGATVGGWGGALGQMGISLTAGSVVMKYSRDSEREADMVGAQIIYDSGFNPKAMVTFFNRLKEKSSGGRGLPFLASHPDPGDRARDIEAILSRFPPKSFQEQDSPEFTRVRASLGSPEVAAAAASSPSPSAAKPQMPRLAVHSIVGTELKTFEHTDFSLPYPANWQLTGTPDSAVEIAPPGGSSNGTLSYGVLISGFQPQDKGNQLDAAVRELSADIELANPSLRVVNSAQATTVHDRPARQLDWIGESAVREGGQPLEERVRMIAFPSKSGVILYFVFVAPDLDFEPLWTTAFAPMRNQIRVR